jgi:catechol 2,3-dioxygenase-like lactoylglutathione lyase family enzyme
MGLRAFPVLYAIDVETTARFYERLGFTRHFRLPPDGPAGYVGLRRDEADLAVVARAWPRDLYGVTAGDAPTSEMFIYVADIEATFGSLEADGVPVIAPPTLMPWGETVAFVLDPDARPVALAAADG